MNQIPTPESTVRPFVLAPIDTQDWESICTRFDDIVPLLRCLKLRTSAKDVAKHLNLLRHGDLKQHMRERNLPPFRILRDWFYLVELVQISHGDQSLCGWALKRGEQPAVYYRFVRGLAGLKWGDVQTKGPDWAKRQALKIWWPYLNL